MTAEPTRPPRTDRDCWPFPCRDYHGTEDHRTGAEPCACSCHIKGRSPAERDDPKARP